MSSGNPEAYFKDWQLLLYTCEYTHPKAVGMDTRIKQLATQYRFYSKDLSNLSLLTDQPWIITSTSGQRLVYVFRKKDKQLLIFQNGEVQKRHEAARWDYIESMNALLLHFDDSTKLFYRSFFDSSLLILKQDGEDFPQLFLNGNHLTDTPDDLIDKVIQKYCQLDQQQSNGATKQQLTYIYQAPFHSIIRRERKKGLLIGKYNQTLLQFEDGELGAVGRDRYGQYFYIKGTLLQSLVYYHDKRSAINGLYHYLSRGTVLRENFREEKQTYALIARRIRQTTPW